MKVPGMGYKRIFVRVPLNGVAMISNSSNQIIKATTIDISQGGVAIDNLSGEVTGHEYHISILTEAGQRIEIFAKLVRVDGSVASFQTLEIDRKSQKIIMDLVFEYQKTLDFIKQMDEFNLLEVTDEEGKEIEVTFERASDRSHLCDLMGETFPAKRYASKALRACTIKQMLFFSMLFVFFFTGGTVSAADNAASVQSIYLLSDNPKSDDMLVERSIADPLEPMNRVFFAINDKLYFWVLKPVKTGYAEVVSPDIRQCFKNFLDNISSPINLVNNLLQGRFKDARVVASRFFINSTLGVFGFGDAATTVFDMTPRPADFGETLGVYGIGNGIYFFWPIIGPSSIRDTVGFAGDVTIHPTSFLDWGVPERAGYAMGEDINKMSLGPDTYEELKKYSIDPYASARQAYIEYRQNQIEKQKR